MNRRVVCISDTHGHHGQLTLPPGDILCHAGDFSMMGRISEVVSFLKWFEAQSFAHRVFVPGNHDLMTDRDPGLFASLLREHAPTSIYLADSGAEVMGLKIWGSGVTRTFGHDWSWNRDAGAPIMRHWDMIPTDTQVLIIHGPPAGIVDRLEYGEHVGCEDLRRVVDERLDDLLLSTHGHLHSAYGRDQIGGKTFVNAALVDERYELTKTPIVVEI